MASQREAIAALEQEKADALVAQQQPASEATKAENESMREKLKKAIDTISKFKKFRDAVNKERADLKQQVRAGGKLVSHVVACKCVRACVFSVFILSLGIDFIYLKLRGHA